MRTCAIVLLLALSSPLLAQELSYNYIQATWNQTDVDAGPDDDDGDGYGLYGSIEVGDMWHTFANFTRADLDRGDFDQVWIGGGLHTPIAPQMSLYFNLAYINVDASGNAASLDDDGLGTALGVRWFVLPQVEVSGAISYSDLGDAGDFVGIDAEAWYYLNRQFALGGGIGFNEDVTRYGIGGRYFFQ